MNLFVVVRNTSRKGSAQETRRKPQKTNERIKKIFFSSFSLLELTLPHSHQGQYSTWSCLLYFHRLFLGYTVIHLLSFIGQEVVSKKKTSRRNAFSYRYPRNALRLSQFSRKVEFVSFLFLVYHVGCEVYTRQRAKSLNCQPNPLSDRKDFWSLAQQAYPKINYEATKEYFKPAATT